MICVINLSSPSKYCPVGQYRLRNPGFSTCHHSPTTVQYYYLSPTSPSLNPQREQNIILGDVVIFDRIPQFFLLFSVNIQYLCTLSKSSLKSMKLTNTGRLFHTLRTFLLRYLPECEDLLSPAGSSRFVSCLILSQPSVHSTFRAIQQQIGNA